MKDFDPIAMEAFQEAMAERYDFARCQRTDGSTYGIPDDANCKSGRKTSASDSNDKGKDKEVALTPGELQKMPFGDVYRRFHAEPSGTPDDKLLREELHRRSSMPGLASKPGKKDTQIAMTPAEFDKALDAAARSQQQRQKQQGIPVPATQGVVDLFNIGSKRGLV